MTQETVKRLSARIKPIYDAVGSVYCKPLKARVYFNKHGWKHLIYDGHDHRREGSVIRHRMLLVPFAADVIKNSTTITKQEVRTVLHNQKEFAVTFIELDCLVDGGKKYITIIIRQIPGDTHHFYSIRMHRSVKRKTKKP